MLDSDSEAAHEHRYERRPLLHPHGIYVSCVLLTSAEWNYSSHVDEWTRISHRRAVSEHTPFTFGKVTDYDPTVLALELSQTASHADRSMHRWQE